MRNPHPLPAACLLALILAFSATAVGGEVFRFGVCLSLTGAMQESGNAYLAGVRIRMEEYNAKAGPGGVRLEAVVRDDRSDPEVAARVVEELATKEGIAAIVGPTSSALTAAMRPGAARHKVVVISPSATSPDIGKNEDWVFTILFDDAFQGRVMGRYVTEKLKARRLAVMLNRTSPYGRVFWESFRAVAEEQGAKIVGEEWYEWDSKNTETHDLTGNLQILKRAGPDVVLLPNYSWEVANAIRQSLAVGLETVFCGGDTWINENVMMESGYNLEGCYFVAGRDINSQAPEMRHYVSLYNVSNEPHARPNSFQGYDALSLLIEAAKNGGSGEAIREGLFKVKDFPLASGPITIDRVKGTSKPGCIFKTTMINEIFTPVFLEEVVP